MDTVQVVDDDEAVRDSLRALLEAYDLHVLTFASAHDYLEEGIKSDRTRTGRTCLILDVHMPEVDGITLLRQMRAAGAGIPVIVITGRTDRSIRESARTAGAYAVLDKPVREAELMAAIHNALELDVAVRFS